MNTKLPTDPYKGTRDFYPEDMAIQRYIFDTWAKTAESFGFERYDASILEPSELYKSKGAENEEMVNEQTYTFIDRGDREVTLRPEMTPTVARMVAARRRELNFPVRWYSIPVSIVTNARSVDASASTGNSTVTCSALMTSPLMWR